MSVHHLRSRDGHLVLDLAIGHVVSLDLPGGLAPLHRAPWADETVDPSLPLTAGIRGLSGDFFCAPFGRNDVANGPNHGLSANTAWHLVGETHEGDTHTATFELDQTIQGAKLQKQLTLRDGQAFLYQQHSFIGGSGAISVAYHPMVRLADGGRLSTSPKAWAETPDAWPEPAGVLAYPARATDLTRFPGRTGVVDLTRLPLAQTNEDFVMLVEAPGSALGWTAVSREREGDTVLILKHPGTLPVTMMWTSNGGRAEAPWSSRHRGVVGLEDAASYSIHGHAASLAPNPLNKAGVPTAIALDPEGTVDIRQIIGGFAHGSAAQQVASLVPAPDRLTVTFSNGAVHLLAFDGDFLSSPA